jgi:hypothetical protein
LKRATILLWQLHEEAIASSPAPAIARNATNQPLPIMVDLDERSLAAGAGRTIIPHAGSLTIGQVFER